MKKKERYAPRSTRSHAPAGTHRLSFFYAYGRSNDWVVLWRVRGVRQGRQDSIVTVYTHKEYGMALADDPHCALGTKMMRGIARQPVKVPRPMQSASFLFFFKK